MHSLIFCSGDRPWLAFYDNPGQPAKRGATRTAAAERQAWQAWQADKRDKHNRGHRLEAGRAERRRNWRPKHACSCAARLSTSESKMLPMRMQPLAKLCR